MAKFYRLTDAEISEPPRLRVHLEWSQANDELYEEHKLYVADTPLPPEKVARFPKKFTFAYKPTGNEKFDFLSYMSANLLISARVRDAIERLEPGTHQMMPIEADIPKSWRKTVPNLQYYFLNCCTRLNAIDVEKSDLKTGEITPSKYVREMLFLRSPQSRLVIKGVVADGHHLWMPPRNLLGSELFISDKLHAIFSSMGVGPVGYHACEAT